MTVEFPCLGSSSDSCLSKLLAGHMFARRMCAGCRAQLAYTMIRGNGYAVDFVPYCEDATTPGLLGQISAVTVHKNRYVKVSTMVNDTPKRLALTLEHELQHVLDPDWDCGNRDVLGRGGNG